MPSYESEAKSFVVKCERQVLSGLQQGGERLCRYRMAEIVALAFIAMLSQKKCTLPRCFHALRDDAQLEAFAHVDNGADNGGIVRAAGNPAHERLVDLQGINRKLPQIAEAGIARAEVIDRELDAQVR